MGWEVAPLIIVVFGSAIVAIAVGLASLRERPDLMAWPLAVMMFAVAAWTIPHWISLSYTDLEQIVFWHRVRYLGTVVAPVAYFVVALRYADLERWLSPGAYALLAVVLAVTLTAVWTNPSHGYFWQSTSVARVGGVSVLVTKPGL